MPRRVSLPGADELFRSTTAPPAVADTDPPPAPAATRRPTRRQRHDEKITVYISASELVELEKVRLELRATHGLGVDRGRIVREALAVILADFDSKGADSILVRRLRG